MLWIYFVSTEEDYCLKGMHLAVCRSGKHHSLYQKLFYFSMFELFKPDLEAVFADSTRTPACLGHFEKLDPLLQSNVTSPC